MNKNYQINEIFYSLQGEGIRCGTANIFIRTSGCNLKCLQETHGFDCDTEFVSGRSLSLVEIYKEVSSLNPDCKNIILTGGEPSLQIDKDFCDFFHNKNYFLSIETNGSKVIDFPVDWITVSPKVAEHAIRQKTAHEVKYVRGYGQGIPKTVVKAEHQLISPAFDGSMVDKKTLNWCINLVKDNPKWRLSIQVHKWLNVR